MATISITRLASGSIKIVDASSNPKLFAGGLWTIDPNLANDSLVITHESGYSVTVKTADTLNVGGSPLAGNALVRSEALATDTFFSAASGGGGEDVVSAEVKTARVKSNNSQTFVAFGTKATVKDGSGALSDGTMTRETSRIKFRAIGNISDLSAFFINAHYPWYLDTAQSGGSIFPDPITLTASIEFSYTTPGGSNTANKIQPFTFRGATSLLVPSGYSATTDPLQIEIADGAFFWIRTCVTVTAGQKWLRQQACFTTYTEGAVVAQDYTVAGTVSNSTGYTYAPLGVYGTSTSRKGSVFIVGDSIARGLNDSGHTVFGYENGGGIMGRSFQNNFAGIGVDHNGDSLDNWQPMGRPAYGQMMGSVDFFICQIGVNNMANSLATLQSKYIPLWDSFLAKGVRGYQTTLTPMTTGTFTSDAGQTVTANESKRTALNDWFRDGAPIERTTRAAQVTGATGAEIIRAGDAGHPLIGYFDLADIAESSRNSGKWKNNGGVAYTGDGTHPTAAMYALLAAGVDTTKFYLW